MNQKDTIRNIKDVNSLSTVLISLVEKSGMIDISRLSNNVFSANEKRGFGEQKIVFICTLSLLSGKVQQILDDCRKYSTEADEVVIVTSSSKKVSDYFKKWLISETKSTKFEFWHEENLIANINKYLPEYWGNNDLFLKAYEDVFLKGLVQES